MSQDGKMTALVKDDPQEFDGNIRRDPRQVHRRQRTKNLVVGGLVIGFVLIVYFVSIVRMSG